LSCCGVGLGESQPVESGPTVAEVVAAFRADQFARASKMVLAASTAKQRACKGLPPEPLASLPCVALTGEAVDGWLGVAG
jgi:hypothetical protein